MKNIKSREPVKKVMMAQYRICGAPARIMTMALGSCLGIVLYDRVAKVGGLAHVMHPTWKRVKNNTNKGKFVDTAIELMVEKLVERGARPGRIIAKIFGGARMFDIPDSKTGVIQIGEANITAARKELTDRKIPIKSESVGGRRGKTIIFDVSDGSVLVRDAQGSEEVL